MMRAVLGFVLAGLILVCGGCTGVEPAMVGAGVTAVETGATVFGKGKAGTYELISLEDARQATTNVADRMDLTFERDRETTLGWVTTYHDDRNITITVAIEQHTETVMFIRADVGMLGPTGLATLYIRQVQFELEEMKKRAIEEHSRQEQARQEEAKQQQSSEGETQQTEAPQPEGKEAHDDGAKPATQEEDK